MPFRFVFINNQNARIMRKNRKFAKNARKRQVIAFFLTLAIFTSIFAALTYGEEWKELLPDFVKEKMIEEEGAPRA